MSEDDDFPPMTQRHLTAFKDNEEEDQVLSQGTLQAFDEVNIFSIYAYSKLNSLLILLL